jgi:hypothetical protein
MLLVESKGVEICARDGRGSGSKVEDPNNLEHGQHTGQIGVGVGLRTFTIESRMNPAAAASFAPLEV